jgi:hypothetical protein
MKSQKPSIPTVNKQVEEGRAKEGRKEGRNKNT